MSMTDIESIYKVVNEESRPHKIKKVNQYYLIDKLGSGYFSKVYLAMIENSHNYYAAKAIHIHESFHNSKTFDREIKLLKILNHPNIIKFHTLLYAPSNDMAYIMMEWANCGNLQQSIMKKTNFSEKSIASIFLQIALALSYLHSKGIVHRDVKPSNILLFSDGTAKLSDFGISHFEESAETVCGTPSYQAPDLFESERFDKNYLSQDIIENKNFDQKILDLIKREKKQTNKINDSLKTTNDILTNSMSKANNNEDTNKINDSLLTIINQNKDINKSIDIEQKTNNDNEYENSKRINSEYSIKNNIRLNDTKKINALDDSILDDWRIDPKKSDVWSLGISLYQTAFGILPYEGQNVYEIVNKINNSPLIIPQMKDRKYTPLLIDLIKKMLKTKASERLSIDEVINHPFFVRYQSQICAKQNEKSSDDIIIVKNKKIMKKSPLDIKPIKPPNQIGSQIVKIDAIICPENFAFVSEKSVYRYTFIDDNLT